MIVNSGYAAFLDGFAGLEDRVVFLYIAYGTGTTAEDVDQTALVNETDRVLAETEIISVYAPFDTLRVAGEFAIGSSPPVVTEIGVFSALTGGTMWARKLVGSTETGSSSFTPPINSTLYVHYDFSMKDGGPRTMGSGSTW